MRMTYMLVAGLALTAGAAVAEDMPAGAMPMPQMPPMPVMASGSMPMPQFTMPEMCMFRLAGKEAREIQAPCEFEGMKKTRKVSAEEMRRMMIPPAPGVSPAMPEMPAAPAH